MMKRIVYGLFLWGFPLFAGTNVGSVFLVNDSPYILTATVLAADGSFLGEITIQPSQQTNFTQNLFPTSYNHPGTPNVSYTPFTVVWQCPSEEYYSVCNQVSPGSLVKASNCSSGNFFCSPKKEKEKKTESTIQQKGAQKRARKY